MNTNLNQDLTYLLECFFNVDVDTDYNRMKAYIEDSTFPERNVSFRKDLAKVISEQQLTPEMYEHLTDHELETQEEVDEFLKTEIWQPLYGDEPIQGVNSNS